MLTESAGFSHGGSISVRIILRSDRNSPGLRLLVSCKNLYLTGIIVSQGGWHVRYSILRGRSVQCRAPSSVRSFILSGRYSIFNPNDVQRWD